MQFTNITRYTLLVVLTVLSLIALAACDNGPSAKQASKGIDNAGLPIVTLAADREGAEFDPAWFTTSIERSDGGFICTIYAAEGYVGGNEVYVAAEYNPESFHSYNIKIGPGVDKDTLGIAAEEAPGRIVAGLVNTPDASFPALEGGKAFCSFQLIPGAIEKAGSNVTQASFSRARNLALYRNTEENWVLAWDYTNPGDSDQDGEVGIRDLQPIGAHYLERVSNNWDDPLRHIDGDENGEINAGDIVPISMNFNAEIWAYQIEMSETSNGEFIVVGQLILRDQQPQLNETVRFEYTFGAQYVEHAWYRVVPIVPMGNTVEIGVPSESICEDGRRIDPIVVPSGSTITITVNAQNLQAPLAHMNSIRVVFPDTFSYVANSANPGKLGGSKFDPDGIWGSFATALMLPPDDFFVERDPGQDFPGMVAIDFSVTALTRFLDDAPVGYGELFNFKLKNEGSEPLTLQFQRISDEGIKRTYYCDSNNVEYFFGNSVGFKVK